MTEDAGSQAGRPQQGCREDTRQRRLVRTDVVTVCPRGLYRRANVSQAILTQKPIPAPPSHGPSPHRPNPTDAWTEVLSTGAGMIVAHYVGITSLQNIGGGKARFIESTLDCSSRFGDALNNCLAIGSKPDLPHGYLSDVSSHPADAITRDGSSSQRGKAD